eukprot:CFRG3688T1
MIRHVLSHVDATHCTTRNETDSKQEVDTASMKNPVIKTLLIDNYDSYTYNLFCLLTAVNGQIPTVIRNDSIDSETLVRDFLPHFDNIVISPGPGDPTCPTDFGIGAAVLRQSAVPIFGVCLGHQGMAVQYGGSVIPAPQVMHGRLSSVFHACQGTRNTKDVQLLDDIPSPFSVVRYHSLTVTSNDLPPELEAIAHSDDGVLMALRHRTNPHWSVQFHPESICTQYGSVMLDNFRKMTISWNNNHPNGRPRIVSPFLLDQLLCSHRLNSYGQTHARVQALSKVTLTHDDTKRKTNDFVVIAACWDDLMALSSESIFNELYGTTKLSWWLDTSRYEAGLSRFSFMGDGLGPLSETLKYDVHTRKVTIELSPKCENRPTSSSSSPTRHTTNTYANTAQSERQYVERASSQTVSLGKSEQFMDFMRERMATERSVTEYWDYATQQPLSADEIPFELHCGYVGYFGYELKEETGLMGTLTDEQKKAQRTVARVMVDSTRTESPPRSTPFSMETSLPTCSFIFADRQLTVDHETGKVWALAMCHADDAHSIRQTNHWFADTKSQLLDLCEHCESGAEGFNAFEDQQPCIGSLSKLSESKTKPVHNEITEVKLRHGREEYFGNIDSAMKLMEQGETYEVCLTTQLTVPTNETIDPLSLHHHLRTRNPAPYACLFRFGADEAIVGSSPEKFLTVDRNGQVESKPIKGTRRRGATAKEDLELVEDLTTDPKDFAENLMIVDLIRNDLAQVCVAHSVHVPKLMHIETYSTVHQLVTTVRGTLKDGITSLDCIRECFPPGSMTGAPKHRTIQLLEHLEANPRGVYSGAMGYISTNGGADMCVTIRTVTINKSSLSIASRRNKCSGIITIVGAGGAIVALSDANEEFEEMLLKAKAPIRSILETIGKENQWVAVTKGTPCSLKSL